MLKKKVDLATKAVSIDKDTPVAIQPWETSPDNIPHTYTVTQLDSLSNTDGLISTDGVNTPIPGL